MKLVEFLLARIAEDEAAARTAASGLLGPEWWEKPGHGRVYSGHWVPVVQTTSYTEQADDAEDAVTHHGVGAGALPHIARWDPARVLAECEAKRRIVEALESSRAEDALLALALPYADHPDYREEWRLEAVEPDPFTPGTRVEVHEVPGGYVVFPAEGQP